MSSIDERVVAMKFNNGQFQSGIKTTMDSLSSLKEGLNLDGAKKSLEGLAEAGKTFSLNHLSTGIDGLSVKFAALATVGITALSNITTSAMNTGIQLVKSLTIDPISQGFGEYEAGLTAFQTILANTKTAGANTADVTNTLATLNDYANKTVYSFGDMSTAMGLFTSNGVNLNDSVTGIKGIYNIVSLTGGNAEKANSAIYQLSQAIATGTVKAQDWISVTNAGFGGPDFQNQLKQTARTHGIKVDEMIKKEGSFKDSLTDGWLTSQVLLETLSQYTGDMSAEQLKSMGYSKKQAEQIIELGKTANDSATKLKSYSALMDTLKSNVVTGWATTFKTLIGNLDEAATLWTRVGNCIGGALQSSSDARNKMLGDWSALGGRAVLIDALSNAFKALMGIFKPISDAFKQIFPATTGAQLFAITTAIDNFTKMLVPSVEQTDNLRRTVAGLLVPFSILWTIVKAVFSGIGLLLAPLFGGLSAASGGLLGVTAKLGDWLVALDSAIKKSTFFTDALAKISEVITFVSNAMVPATAFVKRAYAEISEVINKISIAMIPVVAFVKQLAVTVAEAASQIRASGFGISFDEIATNVEAFRVKLEAVLSGPVANVQQKFNDATVSVAAFGKSTGDTFDGASTAVANYASQTAGAVTASGPLQKIGEALQAVWNRLVADFERFRGVGGTIGDAVGNAITSLWKNIQDAISKIDPNVAMGTLNLSIFAAVAVMLKKFFAAVDLTGGLKGQLVGMFGEVTNTLKSMQTELKAGALLKIAEAVAVLAVSMLILSLIDPARLVPVAIAMSVMFAEILQAMKTMDKIASSQGFMKMPMIGIALVLFGASLILFAIAAERFSKLSNEELQKGLLGFGATVAIIGAALWLFQKQTSQLDSDQLKETSKALLIFAAALMAMALVIKIFTVLGYDTFVAGMKMVAVTLLALTIAINNLPNDAYVKARAMMAMAESMLIMSAVMKIFGSMSQDEMLKSAVMLAGTLLILTVAMNSLTTALPGAQAMVSVAAALLIMSVVMNIFALMSPEGMLKSAAMLAGTLLILTVGMNSMTTALPGAEALLIVAAALWILAPVLAALGQMEWDTIGKGLLALVGVFAVIVIAGYALAPVVPVLLSFGIALALVGVATLFAGQGLVLIGIGLAALAASGAVAIPLFLLLVKGMLDLIPMLVEKIGEGIIQFVALIGQMAPGIVQAFTAIVLALIVSLNVVVPPLLDLLFNILVKLVGEIVDHTPYFVEAACNIIIAILTGISNNIQQIIDAGSNLIINFLNGIANNLPGVIDAGVNVIVSFINGISDPANIEKLTTSAGDAILNFINGLSDAVDKYAEKIGKAAGKLAVSIGRGLSNGLGAAIREVANASSGLAQMALNAMADAFDSHSPSRETFKLGVFAGQGLVNGFTSLSGDVSSSAAGVGTDALNALKNSVSGISEAISGNLDMQPTIRPVLDLSNVQKNAGLIDGLLTPTQLSLDSVYASASNAAAAYSSNQADKLANETAKAEGAATKPNDNLTFVQNNYSPSALSNIEIYRQTHNQISAAKGALSS